MKVAGIIAEYNPFHNGHLYQMEQVRAQTGADFIVAVMSGDFVQRGEPAVYDKYTRTAMALNCGADLVLELPVCFATGSAEDFAAGGVALLDHLGVVDLLCFGSELGNLAPLRAAADVLCREPGAYRAALKESLKQGDSYPAARSAALCKYLADSGVDYSRILSCPNNILAIEYLKALIRQESSMEPFTIRRAGQDYHDADAPADAKVFASATALRRMIQEQSRLGDGTGDAGGVPGGRNSVDAAGVPGCRDSMDAAGADIFGGQIPPAALKALWEEQARTAPLFPDDLSLLLQYRLLSLMHRNADLSRYADMSPELAARLERLALDYDTFSGRIARLKTRQYTYTRISRALLHLILGITAKETEYVPYARVLGFRKSASSLLSKIKRSTSVPLVTKTADAAAFLSPAALSMLNEDLYASHLYQSLVCQKGRKMKNEYTKSVIILP